MQKLVNDFIKDAKSELQKRYPSVKFTNLMDEKEFSYSEDDFFNLLCSLQHSYDDQFIFRAEAKNYNHRPLIKIDEIFKNMVGAVNDSKEIGTSMGSYSRILMVALFKYYSKTLTIQKATLNTLRFRITANCYDSTIPEYDSYDADGTFIDNNRYFQLEFLVDIPFPHIFDAEKIEEIISKGLENEILNHYSREDAIFCEIDSYEGLSIYLEGLCINVCGIGKALDEMSKLDKLGEGNPNHGGREARTKVHASFVKDREVLCDYDGFYMQSEEDDNFMEKLRLLYILALGKHSPDQNYSEYCKEKTEIILNDIWNNYNLKIAKFICEYLDKHYLEELNWMEEYNYDPEDGFQCQHFQINNTVKIPFRNNKTGLNEIIKNLSDERVTRISKDLVDKYFDDLTLI